MKKLALALIFAILIALLGYWYFTKSIPATSSISSAESYIPEDATSLLQVNTLKLRDLILNESFKSPKKMKDLYDNLDSLKGKIEIPSKEVEYFIKNGLNLPDQFLAFEFSIENSSFLATIFPIKSKNILVSGINERNYMAIDKDHYYLQEENLGIFIEGDFCFFIHEKQLSQESLKHAISHLITTKKNNLGIPANGVPWPDFSLKIDDKSSFIADLTTLPNTCVTIEGHHLKGHTKFEVILERKDSSVASIFNPIINGLKSDNSIAHLSLGINVSDFPLESILSEKQIFDLNNSLKTIQGNVGDINKIWDGQLEFCLRKPKEFKEKFVTYSYDDNFEKVENVQWKKSMHPDFELRFGLKDGGSKYLRTKSWVTDNQFNAYPMQTLYYTDVNNHAYIRTDKKPQDEIVLTYVSHPEPNGIEISIDIQQLTDNYPLLFKKNDLEKFRKNLSSINITDQVEVLKHKILVDMAYINTDQSGLLSLMEFLSYSSVVKTSNDSVSAGVLDN